jgi:hypothetical protein
LNILYPIFALIALTLSAGARLGYLRYRAVMRKQVDATFYQAYIGDEPLALRVASRHLINLLEMPILFYIACLVAFMTGLSGSLVLVLAWSYVSLRFIHTFIHLGPNIVIWRFRVFALSILVLAALWIVLFLCLITR